MLSCAATTAPLCPGKTWQPCWTGAEGVVSRLCVWEKRTDGWQPLIILLITVLLPLGDARRRYLCTPPPPLPHLYQQPSVARRSESLRRFNYSPGEDDSLWLNSIEREEEEEEDKKQRMGNGKGGGELAHMWRKRRNDGGRRSGSDDQFACCVKFGDCGEARDLLRLTSKFVQGLWLLVKAELRLILYNFCLNAYIM